MTFRMGLMVNHLILNGEMKSIYTNDISLNDGVVTKYYDFIDVFNQTFVILKMTFLAYWM